MTNWCITGPSDFEVLAGQRPRVLAQRRRGDDPRRQAAL